MPGDQLLYIDGLLSGDKGVIDKVYNKYHRKIYAFANSYLKLDDEAADIVQDVFIKLWESRMSLRRDSNLDAFIFTLTRNAVMSVFRKKSSEKKYMDYIYSLSIDADDQTNEALDYNSLEAKLNMVIEQLPTKRRQVFELSRKQGLKNHEIATQLNISEKTVEDHITKALAFLRKHMESYGVFAVLLVFLHG